MNDAVALVQELYDAYAAHDAARFRAVLTPEFISRRNSVVFEGAEALVAHIEREWRNRPDAIFKIQHITPLGDGAVMEGVWEVTSATPVHLPNSVTLEPTGKRGSLPVAGFYRAGDDRLVSETMYYDTLGFWQGMGHTVTVA